jgi:hypothetical protein
MSHCTPSKTIIKIEEKNNLNKIMNNPKIEISIELLHLFSSMKGRKTDKGK